MLQRFGDGRDWFFEQRFGLFLHFGLYSIDGWHEQDQWRRAIPAADYVRRAERFNPTAYDPDAILDLAESVGMGYVCLTTKHHDGFCLWDTAQTDYNVMHTPYGKDIVKMLADACHRRGFRLGLYYSIADWHQPNYPNEGRHHELPGPKEGDAPDWGRYLAFLKAQVRELCTDYGEVSEFWWDMNVPEHRDPSVNAMLRALQPSLLINDRGFDDGDFGTPEREYKADAVKGSLAFARPTEACNSVGTQSWGFRRDEDYYTCRHLIESMDMILARGGNYLLNVGPDGSGAIPEEASRILTRIGAWYAKTREAFDGCEPASELTENRKVLLTRRDTTLYVHLAQPAASTAVVLNPIRERPQRAVLLNTGEAVETAVELVPALFQRKQPCLRLRNLPVEQHADETLVVRLDFETLPAEAGQTAGREFEG